MDCSNSAGRSDRTASLTIQVAAGNVWEWVVICSKDEAIRFGICIPLGSDETLGQCEYDSEEWNRIFDSMNSIVWFWILLSIWACIFVASALAYVRSFCFRPYHDTWLYHDSFLNRTKKLTLSPLRAVLALSVVRLLYFFSLLYGGNTVSTRTCIETVMGTSSSSPLLMFNILVSF
jgi:hypothetical protein